MSPVARDRQARHAVAVGVMIVVSGLPASGKSTVGRSLSERLTLPFIDKDVILEALFDSLGSPDQDARNRLSRASDEVLYALAATTASAVLVNWWHHDTSPARLNALATPLVEVFCECPVEVAARRFHSRTRHPGHHDPKQTNAEIEARVSEVEPTFSGPLRLGGPLLRVATSRPVDAMELAGRINAFTSL